MTRRNSLQEKRRRCGAIGILGRPAVGHATEQGGLPMQDGGNLKMEVIGVIETPFHELSGTPVQPSRAGGARGRVRLDARFAPGLRDLEGFERVWLIYWLHQAADVRLLVTPFLDDRERGIFSTRAPARPSPIGMSVVRLLGIEGAVLDVADVDMLDGTPLLDIKPYVPEFDSHPGSRAGWFESSRSDRRVADDRFSPKRQP